MPNNYWDDLFAPEAPAASSSGGLGVFEDLFSDDNSMGMPTDEWTTEEQKSEGWDGFLDNPITRTAGQVVSVFGDNVLSAARAGADLFSYADEKMLSGATSMAEKYGIIDSDVASKMQTTFGETKDEFDRMITKPLGDAADLMGDITSDLSTKKDSGGGYMAEMGGNLDSLKEADGVGDVMSTLWETAEDTAGMALDVGAGMAGTWLSGGPIGEVASLGKMGAGMALQVYGDTYNELTQKEDDSRVTAVAVAASNAMVQGFLEKIGWETALGKGPVAEFFEVKAKDTLTKAILARAMITAPTEGAEEFLQGFSDILAKNLPNVQRDGWDATLKTIQTQAYQELPEQAFTGTVFGGLLGGGVAPIQKLGARDVAARNGGLPNTPDDKLANAIGAEVSEDKAKQALVDVVDQVGDLAGGGDLTGVFPTDTAEIVSTAPLGEVVTSTVTESDPSVTTAVTEPTPKKKSKKKGIIVGTEELDAIMEPLISAEAQAQEKAMQAAAMKAEKLAAVKNAAKSARAGKKAADIAIIDLVASEEADRAAIADSVNEADLDRIGEAMMASVEKIGQETQAKANAVATLAQNIVAMSQGAGADVMFTAMPVTTPEMVAIIKSKAYEQGVEVPESALANPQEFDWNGWVQEEVEMAKAKAKQGLKAPSEAITASVSMDTTHPIAQMASVPPAPSSAVLDPIQSEPLQDSDAPSQASKVLEGLKAAGKRAEVSSNLLMSNRNTSIQSFRDLIRMNFQGVPIPLSRERVVSALRASSPQMSDRAFDAVLAKVEGDINWIVSATSGGLAPSWSSLQVNVNAIENAMLKQNTNGLFRTSGGTIPFIGAIRSVSRKIKEPEDYSLQADRLKSSGRTSNSLIDWVLKKNSDLLVQNVFLTDQERNDAIARDHTAAKAEDMGEAILPQMKQILYELWQSGDSALLDVVGQAIRVGHQDTPAEMGKAVAQHLADMGMFIDLNDEVQGNDVAALTFGKAIINVGRGVMSPWAIERGMLELGADTQVAKAGVAVFEAMAERWAMKNGKLPIEWWDRLADRVSVEEFLDSGRLGWAMSETSKKVGSRRNAGLTQAMSFGNGILALVKNARGTKKDVGVTLHELIHNVFMSGLMYEMLEPSERSAMESFVGEQLWHQDGEPMKISSKGHEIMAVGFEKFIYENRAPNKRVLAAFTEIKRWFRQFINSWLGGEFEGKKYNTVDDISIYGVPSGDIHLTYGDISLSNPVIRAYYQLMNVEPDGTEIAYNSPSLSLVLEDAIAQNTGINATGLLTKPSTAEVPAPSAKSPGWNIHKGTTPTESEWRGMLGITNDDDNGTHTQDTLMELESYRQDLGDLSREVKAQASSRMPMTPEEDAAVEVQLAIASEAPLKDEPIYEAFMDNMMDKIMLSGKSAYSGGKKVNHNVTEEIQDMLRNFISKMQAYSHLSKSQGISFAVSKVGRDALQTGTTGLIRAWRLYEKNFGDLTAGWQRLFEGLAVPNDAEINNARNSAGPNATAEQKAQAEADYRAKIQALNLGSKAMMINHTHSLGKLTDKVAEKRPQIYDTTINDWRDIPGARSFKEILTSFSQMLESYYKSSTVAQGNYKDWHAFMDSAMRDLRAWMFAARQMELIENNKEAQRKYEKAVADREHRIMSQKASNAENALKGFEVLSQKDEPEIEKPRVTEITEEGTKWAESITYLMEARYGKNLAMFKVAAAELTQWENHMAIDKLLAVKMIPQKEYDDMKAKGKSHIPMYRIRDAIAKSGVLNPRIDDSAYKILDYLKHDISMKMEDPLNAMLLKAAAIEALTYRQAAKNALGERILMDIKWWEMDRPDTGVSIFTDKVEVTSEQYKELQKDPNNVLSTTKRMKKNAKGETVAAGYTYYHIVPYTGDDMKAQLKHVLNSERAKAKYGKLTDEQRLTKYEQSIFAFFPEPGKPMYVLVTDPELQKAFFTMNHPQVLYANSVRGAAEKWVGDTLPIDEDSALAAKLAHYSVRGMISGYFGFNKVARGLMTSNPSFIFNMMPRDAPVSVARSRHGLRWRDVPSQFIQSAALMFPSMRELDPGKYINAEDASHGLSTFSGLAAADLDGALNTDVLASIVHTRGEKTMKAKTGHFKSKMQLMWNDFAQFMAREGVEASPGKMWSEAKRGKNIGKNLLMVATSPINIPKGILQFIGTIGENATRLAERSLTIKEDMSLYPSLVGKYDPQKAVGGKILAGFTGSEHRNRWERAKRKLAADPTYKVNQADMPVQFDANERDYSMSHVTLNFPQKGYWTTSWNQFSLFNNPMHQDFYTNMMILAKHSAMKKAMSYALGKDYVPARDQPRLDQAAFRWLYKSFFYTTLPMAAMMLMYGTGDDDDSLEWQSQTFIEKVSYFWVPTHKIGLTEKPFRVATGLGLNKLMFADLPMAGWLAMSGKDKRAMGKWFNRLWDMTPFGMSMNLYAAVASNEPGTWGAATGGQGDGLTGGIQSLITDTIPIGAPESVNPIVEVYGDRDSWRHRAIKAPEALYREDPTEINREKFNLLVNSLTKKLGFLNMQPAQVKYLVARYTPGSIRWMPEAMNQAMEAVAAGTQEGIPEDVQASNSPVVGQSPTFLPRFTAKPAWGMGNEFVQDLLNTAREASNQRNSYDKMVDSRKPVYMSEHRLIQDDIYYGKVGADGVRSGGLSGSAKWVIEQNKIISENLRDGTIDQAQAMELKKAYTLYAMESMRNIITQLGE